MTARTSTLTLRWHRAASDPNHPRRRLTAARRTCAQTPVYVLKAQLFRVLGHPVRIRILELLTDGERTVGDLQAALSLDSSGTSQHLAALRQQGVLESRRAGTSVYYRIRDPRVSQLLAVAKQILTSALSHSQTLLSDLADVPPAHTRR